MNSRVWRSPLCIRRRHASSLPTAPASCRPRSTLSAINRAVRASREDGKPNRGGRGGHAAKTDWPRVRDGNNAHRIQGLEATKSHRPETQKERQQDTGTHEAGLLRGIKSACRSVQTIREHQARGEDVSSMIDAARSFLNDVNEYVMSGSFRDEPAQAVASLFSKNAPHEVFVAGRPRGDSHTAIYQKRDGTFDLFVVCRGDAESYKAGDNEKDHQRGKQNISAGTNNTAAYGKHRNSRSSNRHERKGDREDVPVSIPYTTAASEFLYGYNSVLAALKGRRRKLYHLYIHPKIVEREMRRQSESDEHGKPKSMERPGHQFVTLAKEAEIPFHNEFDTKLLDKMSGGRPHNGLVLEASKLPVPPVLSLGKLDRRGAAIPLTLGRQTAEEAAVNGTPDAIKPSTDSWRYPLVVLLDGILDEGNLGNIIRTCYFYGADAVAVAKTCAPLSLGVMAKASSGACEAVRLLAINEPSKFVFDSAKHRWKIYAAVAPTDGESNNAQHVTTLDLAKDSPVARHPCILMLGSEGHGLRGNLKRRADRFVSINKRYRPDDSPEVGLDSLNVTVATGVLLESFLTKPCD